MPPHNGAERELLDLCCDSTRMFANWRPWLSLTQIEGLKFDDPSHSPP